MPTKTRTELKQFFVKNAIPTQGNFADLIDAQLNQQDDGVFKQANAPLSVVAVAGEQKRVLQLYSAYPSANPDWLISLNPKLVAPAVGNTAGFGIADAAGTTRLLLDPAGNLTVSGSVTATGDLNYGGLLSKLDSKEQFTATVRAADFRLGHTTRSNKLGRALVDNTQALLLNCGGDWSRAEVQSPLTVGGVVEINLQGAAAGWGKVALNTTALWGDGANQYATIGAGGASGIMFYNPHVVWHSGESRASIRYGRSGGTSQGAFWDVGTRANNAFSWSYNGIGDHKLWLTADGSLGIGTTAPGAKLDVVGDVAISGFTRAAAVAVNNANNTGVGRGLWLWAPNDSGHVIYSAAPGPTGKSPANVNAAAGYHNNSHRMRFRTANGQGFLFENHNETSLVDIAADTGNLWTRGAMYVGGSDLYFTQTDHVHTGIGNAPGYAAIENSAGQYNALMLLGRNIAAQGQAVNRVVKLWDYLEVNGTLRVTGQSLRIGDWELYSDGNSLLFRRGAQTVARFSVGHDRFNVFRNLDGHGPYCYYNASGTLSTYNDTGYPP